MILSRFLAEVVHGIPRLRKWRIGYVTKKFEAREIQCHEVDHDPPAVVALCEAEFDLFAAVHFRRD